MFITTLVVSFLVCCRLEVNLQPTVNQERNDKYGNQHYSRELLMMGILVPETY